MKLYDEEGNEKEAFTKEEVDAQIAALTKESELEKTKQELEATKAALAEAGLSDGQKKRLKEQKELAEITLETVKADLSKEVADLKASLISGQKNRLIGAVSSDEETTKKINERYESLMKTGEYGMDEEGVARAVADAATLVTGSKPRPGIIDGLSGSGDRGFGHSGAAPKVETAESKEQRKLLGISDEEATKFAPKQ